MKKTPTPGQVAEETWRAYYKHGPEEAWRRVAAAVLASQWRPVSEPPEDEDALVFMAGGYAPPDSDIFAVGKKTRLWWFPIPSRPSEPTPDAKRLDAAAFRVALFGEFCDNNWGYASGPDGTVKFFDSVIEAAWQGWQARARRAK